MAKITTKHKNINRIGKNLLTIKENYHASNVKSYKKALIISMIANILLSICLFNNYIR